MKVFHSYDHALKQLFSYPEMIQSLITTFVPDPWVKDLDFLSLHSLSTNHVTEDLRTRDNDLIWKIRAKGEWVYLIFLLEFQSNVDNFMAVRILTYCGLIYQDLLKNKKENMINGR